MQSPPDLPNSSASRYEWSTIRRVELTESGKSSLGLIEKFQRDSHSWHASHFLPQDASLVTNFPNMCDKILNESKVCNYIEASYDTELFPFVLERKEEIVWR